MAQFIYKCCSKSFNGIFPYKEHLENKYHDKMNKHYYNCKFCNRRYDEALLFINHCLKETHHGKVKQKEILNKVNVIQKLRQLNSTTCSSVSSTGNIKFKCPECNVNISNVWTEADKHFRSEKHIKNLIEKEIHEMLKLSRQNLPSRPAVREKPINCEKLSEHKNIKMEIQRENSNCNSKILKKNTDKSCDKSSERDLIKKNETLLQNQNAKISQLSQSGTISSCQEISTKSKKINQKNETKKDKSKLPNSEPSSGNTNSTKSKFYNKHKSSLATNLKTNGKTVQKEITIKTVKTITTTTTVVKRK